ncbi:MAG: Ig-like domain-containing protein [Clostridiales bacterium]|nr:Ig-like domain-containing protein [Clostridiales bacterium]
MFSYVKTGTDVPVKVDCADSVYVTVKLNNPIPLPETVSAIYNDGSAAEVPVGEQTDFQVKATDAYSGETSLHFWNADAVEFRVEQQVSGLRDGSYNFSLQAQGGDVGDDAVMYIYVSADGEYYEQSFSFSGWRVWQQPKIENIPCHSGSMTVGVYIKAAGGGWGTLDDFLLNPIQ